MVLTMSQRKAVTKTIATRYARVDKPGKTPNYAWQADVRVPRPPATPSTALLNQLPDTSVAVRGRPLTELLRPAYHALGRGGQAELA
jgi:hypothetical protein